MSDSTLGGSRFKQSWRHELIKLIKASERSLSSLFLDLMDTTFESAKKPTYL